MRITKVKFKNEGKNFPKVQTLKLKKYILIKSKDLSEYSDIDNYVENRLASAKKTYTDNHCEIELPKKYEFIDNAKNAIINSIINQDLPVHIEDLDNRLHLNVRCPEDDLTKIFESKDKITEIFKDIEYYFNVNASNMNDTFLNCDEEIKEDKKTHEKKPCGNYRKDLVSKFAEHIILNRTDNFWIKMSISNIDKIISLEKKRHKGYIEKEKATNVYVISRCKGMIKNYITQKFIQLGKGVYHFYDFKNDNLKNAKYITSMNYEIIKANESITQQIYVCLCYAANNISNSVEQLNGQNVLDFKSENLAELTAIDIKNLYRFYGGKSACEKDLITTENMKVIIQALNNLRNRCFHYDPQAITPVDKKMCKHFADNELMLYKNSIIEKYKHVKACKYYNKNDVKELIEDIYSKINIPNPYIPSFKRINTTKLETLFDIPLGKDNEEIEKASCKKFIAIQIYYGKFLHENNLGKDVYEFLNTKLRNSFNGNKEYFGLQETLNLLDKKDMSFGEICSTLQREYISENSKDEKEDKEKRSDNLNILLRQAIQQCFKKYLQNKYEWIFEDELYNNDDIIELKDININTALDLSDSFCFYVLAKFITPKQLSCLCNEFTKYKQYVEKTFKKNSEFKKHINIQDIKIKSYYSVTKSSGHHSEVENIINVLNICQESCGKISSNITDYYETGKENLYKEYEDKYAIKCASRNYMNHLNQFLADKIKVTSALDARQKLGYTFADEKNFTVLSQVERARMYGIADKCVEAYKKFPINLSDIEIVNNYIPENSVVRFNNIKELKAWKDYQNTKNKVELNWISTFSDITIDLYSQMISWCYKFERDVSYFLLGITYLVTDDKKLKDKANDIWEVFTFPDGKERPDGKLRDNKSGVFNTRFADYLKEINNVKTVTDKLFSMNFCINEKKNKLSSDKLQGTRNSIDHFDYFKKNDKSIIDYYFECYKLVDYDIKLKHNVFPKFIKVLERNKITSKFNFNNDDTILTELISSKAKYTINDKGQDKEKLYNVFVEEFCKMLATLLQYPHESDNIRTVEKQKNDKKTKNYSK